MMTRMNSMQLLLLGSVLLLLMYKAGGEEQVNNNNTDAAAAAASMLEEETSITLGNCLCKDKGILKKEYIPQVPASSGLPPNATCADIQGFFPPEVTDCPELGPLREICCSGDLIPQYQCSQNIRRTILTDNKNYDRFTIPSNHLIHSPLEVSVKLDYQTVTDVNEAKGTIEIFVWLNLKWKDPRLAWEYNPDPNSTCSIMPILARASLDGDSEIWVPDLDLYNQADDRGVKGMGASLAEISSDGTVSWTRDGTLKAICWLENLAKIPFDNLGCQFIMGPQNQFFGINYTFFKESDGGGLTIGEFSSPYAEYRLLHANPGIFVKPKYGHQWFKMLFFEFQFARGTNFYIQSIILPVAIFTYLSIFTMITGLQYFQRLALNFTLLLVTVAQKISTARLLPVTDQHMWIVDFTTASFLWIAANLAETLIVAITHRIREDRRQDRQKEARRTKVAAGMMGEEEDDDEPSEDETTMYNSTTLEFTMIDVDAFAAGKLGTSSNHGEGKPPPPLPQQHQQQQQQQSRPSLSCVSHWLLQPFSDRCYTFSLTRFDWVSFFLSFFTYTLFLIVSLTCRDSWGRNLSSPNLVNNTHHYY